MKLKLQLWGQSTDIIIIITGVYVDQYGQDLRGAPGCKHPQMFLQYLKRRWISQSNFDKEMTHQFYKKHLDAMMYFHKNLSNVKTFIWRVYWNLYRPPG